MNKFEINFFTKYIGETQVLLTVIHKHFSVIFLRLFFWLSLAILPSFVYYYSINLKEYVDFYFLEFYLILVYLKIIYDIFDWYNDVWIITDNSVIDLKWSLLKKKIDSVEFGNIEGMGVEQDGIIDTILKKGDIVIHKIGDDKFVLTDVFQAFNKIDLIESIIEEYLVDENEDDITEKRFNMLINAFGGYMEGLKDNQKDLFDNTEEIKEKIEEIKSKDGTIDLR